MKYGIQILIPCLLALAACNVTDNKPPAEVPGPVRNPTAIVVDSQVTVSWSAPETNGGSTITGYRVVHFEDSRNFCDVPATIFSCTLSGIPNGVTHRFMVWALNSVGFSPEQDVIGVLPSERPNTPDSLLLTTASGQVTASWLAPKNSGLPTTGYTVTTTPGSQTCTTTGTTCTVTGLTNGTVYSFSVTATNDSGTSAPSAPVSTVPMQWTVQTSGTTHVLNEVVWTGSQLATVGDSGTILTSSDGSSWTPRVSGTDRQLNSLVWANGQFVAVGDSGCVLTSSDGVVWVVRNSGVSAKLTAVAASATGFVAVGARGTVLTSLNGAIWADPVAITTADLMSVAYSGSEFMAVETDGWVWASTNGTGWAKRQGSSSALNSIIWTGSRWVVVGTRSEFEMVCVRIHVHCYPYSVSIPYPMILTSIDGISWTDSHLVGTDRGKYIQPNSVAWSGNRYIAASGGGASLISLDGIFWMRMEIPDGVQLNSVIWTGTQWVTVGVGGRILISPH
jgi:hypothetical protein